MQALVEIDSVFSRVFCLDEKGQKISLNRWIELFRDAVLSATSYMSSGCQFSDNYRNGTWDGRIRLQKTLSGRIGYSFPTGLVGHVVQMLQMSNIAINYLDCRSKPVPHCEPLHELAGFTLRSYQNRMISSILEQPESIYSIGEEWGEYLYDGTGIKTPLRVSGLGIWCAATGGGKTLTVAGLIGRLAVKTLFVVYGNNLVLQTYRRFEEAFSNWFITNDLTMGLGIEGNLDEGFVTVAGISTLSSILERCDKTISRVKKTIGDLLKEGKLSTTAKNLLREYLSVYTKVSKSTRLLEIAQELYNLGAVSEKVLNILGQFPVNYRNALGARTELIEYLKTVELLVYDEAHGAGSKMGYGFCQECPAYYRLAMSATPLDRSDEANLKVVASFGDLLVNVTSKELRDAGVLPPAEIFLLTVLGEVEGKWPGAYTDGIVNYEDRNSWVFDVLAIERSLGMRCLVLFDRIEHGENLGDGMEAGRGSLHGDTGSFIILDGDSSLDEREEGIDLFKSGEIDVLFASKIFKQGIDLPEIDVLIVASGGKGKIPVLQGLGRGLRGTRLRVYDFSDFQHKILARHSLTRHKIYESQGCYSIKYIQTLNELRQVLLEKEEGETNDVVDSGTNSGTSQEERGEGGGQGSFGF